MKATRLNGAQATSEFCDWMVEKEHHTLQCVHCTLWDSLARGPLTKCCLRKAPCLFNPRKTGKQVYWGTVETQGGKATT